MKNSSLQTSISFTVFLLSGVMIFSPLHKSDNLFISLVFTFIIGLLSILAATKIYGIKYYGTSGFKTPSAIVGIIISAGSVFASLLLITETIKDVSYIANRGISFAYYCFIATAILIVSYYLCSNSSTGIFRFCIPAAIPFFILIVIIFSALYTTGISIENLSFGTKSSEISSSVQCGITSGLFFFSDTIIFIYCFKNQICDKHGVIPKRSIITGFTSAFLFIAIYNTVTFLIFGNNLTKQLQDPDYALIKLVPGIDMTELISAVRIISFIIKSSVYIYSSSKLLGKVFSPEKKLHVIFIPLMYLSIPPVFTFFFLKDKTLGYGAFQNMIFMIIPAISLLFLLIILLSQKNIE